MLPVPVSLWTPPADGVGLDGVAFDPKPELHVTLVGGGLGDELHAVLGERYLAAASRAGFEQLDWSFVRGGRWLMLCKRARVDGEWKEFRSVIERVEMPAMARFHFALGQLLGRELALPPPHMTLFTAGRAKGIGVANGRQLRSYAVREVGAEELGFPCGSDTASGPGPAKQELETRLARHGLASSAEPQGHSLIR